MTYKRIDDFEDTIKSVIAANQSNQYNIVITQTIPTYTTDDKVDYYNEIEKVVLKYKLTDHFKSIHHISTPSASKLQYGNAFHSFRNLVHGIHYCYQVFPQLDSLIVMEEDIVVSNDIFEFFEASRHLINQSLSSSSGTRNITFATSAFFLHTTHPQYNWKLDKPIKRKSIRNQVSLALLNPRELINVRFQGEIEFKVLAWMLHKSVAKVIIDDFLSIEEWVKENDEHKIENTPNSKKPDLLYQNCNCWNHDRYLELRFKENWFIGSQSPRVSHIPRGGYGLSNPGSDYGFPVNEHYTRKDQFTSDSEINGKKGLWSILKDHLPSMECPNRVNCYSNSTGEMCGSVYVSTCLNIWGLECVPCSGRQPNTLDPTCMEKYPKCCGDKCNAHSPFFLTLPSLFSE
eukprot:gene2474-3061_t